MKKLVLLYLVAAAAFGVWKFAGQSGGSDPLADLESRLAVAERSYQSAGRASTMSGVDSTADAEADIGRIETEAWELGRKATSEAAKAQIRRLLDHAATVRHRIG